MRRRYSGDVVDEAPGVHLSGSPSALTEEEIAYKRRKRAYHEAALPAERRACDDADGDNRLEIRDGREDDPTRCGKRGDGIGMICLSADLERSKLRKNTAIAATATTNVSNAAC